MDIKKFYLYEISFLSLFLLKTIIIIMSITSIYNYLVISNIKLENYNEKNNTITIKIIRKSNKINSDFSCNAITTASIIKNKGVGNSCYLILHLNNKYKIYLSNLEGYKSKEYNISDFINNVIDLKYTNDIVYLVPEETYTIKYTTKSIDNKKNNYNFVSSDPSIVSIKNDVITGIKAGTTTIKNKETNKSFEVIVTDLISKPYVPDKYKEHVPCHQYSEADAALLDKILAYKINNAGYKTRGAVIAAARFLTIEFKYRIPYFYENGRVHSSGVHYVDGEGRYYHTGLYLSDNKIKDIAASWTGPAIWGCKIRNLEDEPYYGYISGVMMPNGLDCSGFVSWALKNAGFDPGDIGAGETEYPHQMTDLGAYTKITMDLINSGKIKTGDLINFWGHIAIIIGQDKDNFYVAESLQYFGGVVPKVYKKTNIMDTFTHVVLMDDYYQNDGNYTDMW